MMYVSMSLILYKSYLKSKDRSICNTSLSLLCFMAAFAVGSISSSSNISKEWLWLFWGVVIAYIGYVQRTDLLSMSESEQNHTLWLWRSKSIFLCSWRGKLWFYYYQTRDCWWKFPFLLHRFSNTSKLIIKWSLWCLKIKHF